MATIADLEREINMIKDRNRRVEADKTWEISWSRKIVIAGVTYIAIFLFLFLTNFPNPLEGAIIPTLAFLLANMSLPIFKDLWLKYIYRKK